ncbi:hypothetical protein DCD74_06565 [Lysobacter oculi]|uniref:YdhG-like domain-containing protein n=1 Tax=Solilutibacter oculi TaxID=2698682 RepID=A0A344J5U0_9GAMM|nr:DUF1801 domain-containing protein [Lysobacter oculi]AXA84400.1 hypothetical protein DCD74_06565 [Lysobacter oculi]
MAEPKTKPTSQSLADFLAGQPDARRRDCEAIDAMMREASGEPAVMWGAIVGYGRYLAPRADGSAYEWPMIGFSPRKQALVLYLMADFEQQAALLSKVGKHTTSKACLYIKRLSDVDAGVLRQMIERSVAAMEPRRIR